MINRIIFLAVLLLAPTIYNGTVMARETMIVVPAETLLEKLSQLVAPLPDNEKLVAIKTAENRFSERLRLIFSDPKNKDDDYIWATKVMAGDYGILGLLATLYFPSIGTFYKERADIYSAYVRGELWGIRYQNLEQQNEKKKQAALIAELRVLGVPDHEREKSLTELGFRLGDIIHGHAVILAGRDRK